ncbi:putative minor structural protein [Bacillus phage PK2]|nr:putative minor structural protein [Bacillus phage PK2]
MALSGSFHRNINTHWRVRATWSGSQSISGNYTDITLKVYWESTDSYGTTYTSTTKTGYSVVDGTRENFTWSAKLSGKQSKLVKTQTKRVYHASDGKKSTTLTASLDIELNISGWVGTVTISDTVTLNTIPRASSMSSSASWTAGSNRTISLDRASTSFNHEVEISVKRRDGAWDWIKRVDFAVGESSKSTSFSLSENTEIFTHLDGRSSADTRMVVQTFSGSTLVGEKTYTGTVTAPEATRAKIDNPTGVSVSSGQGHSTVWIDQTINLSLPRKNSSFTHTVRFKDSNGGNTVKTLTGQGSSASWTPTTTEQDTLYNKTPNSIEFDGQIEVDTFYNGVKVRSTVETDLNYRVRNADPIFNASQVTYKDINSTTVGITGNDQLIVQNKSTFRAWVNSVAQAQKGASIASYVLTINGQTASAKVGGTTDGVGYYNFPKPIDAGTDQTLTIKVTDTRGLSVTVTKNVTVVPYFEPSLALKVERVNSFEATTFLSANGNYASISGSNTVTNIQYRYREKGLSSWTVDWTDMTIVASGGTVNADTVSFELSNIKEYDFEVKVIDKLSERVYFAIVGAGQPVFFIDPIKRSIGFNDSPTNDNEFRVNGRIVFGANMWASNAGGESDAGGALFLNNSDITGVNGIFMNDISNNKGEGIHFLKSGKPTASSSNLDYDTWYIRDGRMYWDNNEFLRFEYGDTYGSALILGAGGQTVIGSGESANTWYDNHSWGATREDMVVASDNSVWIVTNMNTSFNDRVSFQFNTSGDINVPRQVNSGSNLRMNGYNTIENLNDRLYVHGYSGVTIENLNKGGTRTSMEWNNDGSPLIQSMTIYNRTYSGSANMYITGYGALGRSTSASKYKTDIKTASELEFAERILSLEPKSWIDKTESYEKTLKQMGFGEFVDAPEGELPRHYGLIAEDLVSVGLEQFVQYGGDGQVEGLEYDRVWTLLIPIVRNLKQEVETLKAELETVKTTNGSTNE